MKNKIPKPIDKIAENHTVTCHENDIDIFKSAGFLTNLDTSKQLDKPVILPGGSSDQSIGSGSDLKKKTLSNVVCTLASSVETKRQIQRTGFPCSQGTPDTLQVKMSSGVPSPSALNLSNSYVPRTTALPRNTTRVTVSKNNPHLGTPQNVPNPRMFGAVPHYLPVTPLANLSSTTHQQASPRTIAPNMTKNVRNLLTPRSSVASTGGFSRARNVHNISPMDLLIDLTRPKSNSTETTLGNQNQSYQFLMTPQQSNVAPRASNPRSVNSSRVSTVRTTRTTPIPLAPKPAPYPPVSHAQQPSPQTSNFKRPIPKITAPSKAKTTPPAQLTATKTTATNSLIFHSTEFIPKGNTVVQMQTKTSTTAPFSSATQVKSRPTHVAQNRLQGTPPASSIRSTVPVTTKVVQLSKISAPPSFRQVPASKIVNLSTSPSQPILKSNQITSKIIELNPDPAQLAANFLRLRAKATQQGGSKTISLVSPQSNSAHHKLPGPVLPVSIATPTPLQQHSSKLDASLPVSTTPKVSLSNSCVVTPTPKSMSQNSVAAVKGSGDSDGMAVVVGSPEQITKLLSENPNMIQLLGSKSTDYLGKLLTSHSKREAYMRQLCETTTTGGQQNKCDSVKEALKRPTPRMIDLTKSPSKHVIDLTKDTKSSEVSSNVTPSTLSSTPSTLSSTTTPSKLSLTSSNRPPITASSVKTNKIDLTKCRNAVRKLDRSCLNTVYAAKALMHSTVSIGKPAQPDVRSPTLDVHPSALTPTNAKSNPQYIFHNRRFLHATLDTPSLEKKANRVSPLPSPSKIMAHVQDQSKNIKPVVSESQEGMKYYKKLQASKQQREQDKAALNNGDTASISKKDIVKSRGKRTYTKRAYTKRKGSDKDASKETKKNDAANSAKRKNDEKCLRTVKRTKIDEDDIVLPDFARVKQSDNRSKRLEKVNQELNVMFSITSEEGLEVKARTCEGTFMFCQTVTNCTHATELKQRNTSMSYLFKFHFLRTCHYY